MGIIVRQSFFNTVVSYIGVALGFVTTIWMYPNILEADQYGLTRVLVSLGIVVAQFTHLGMKNVIIRYFPRFENRESHHHGMLFWTLVVPMAGFLLFWGLFMLLRPWVIGYYAAKASLFQTYANLLIPLVAFILMFEVLDSYVRALYHSVISSFLKEVLLRALTIGLLLGFLYGWIDFEQFMLLFIGAYALQPAILLVYLALIGELRLKPDFKFLDRSLLREMGSYALFALMGGLTSIIVGNIDIIMLGGMAGLDNTAIYAVAFYVGSVIGIPQRSINKIALPIVSDALHKEDYPQVAEIYHKSSLNQLIFGILLLIGVWANLHNLMKILPPEYGSGSYVILVVGLAKLFDMATGINGGIILTSRYYRFDLWTNLFLVALAIVTNLLLIPPLGILGAAIATAISIFVYNFVKMVFVWKKFSMQPFERSALYVILLGLGVLGAASLLPRLSSVMLDIGYRSILISIAYLGLVLLFNLSDDLNRIAEQLRKKLISRD